MIKTVLFSLFFIFSINIWSQSIMLTAEEIGRMYHIIQKSQVLKRNLDKYFDYSGKLVYFKYDIDGKKDSLVDYDSVAKIISLEPSLLKVDQYGLSNESTGLLAELSSKMALFQLYTELKNRENQKEEGISDKAYQYFLDTLVIKLPNGAVRKKNGKNQPSQNVIDLINPNLFFNQRSSALSAFQTITQPQQKSVIEAINYATRSYLQYKGKEYFSKISHVSPAFKTNLIACGDGSSTDGLLAEREKIYKHKNELGDPIGVGLFTYETTFESGHKNKQTLVPKQTSLLEFDAIPNDYTTLHLSMWGFNKNQQTTVAVYREDNMYLLYANKITKELSPDTTFGKGATLQYLISQLENKAIPDLEEQINGKKGIRSKLGNKDTSYNYVLLEIVNTEMELINLRYNGLKNKKKTKKTQNHLAWLYDRKITIKKQQEELQAELADAEERMARFNERLFELKSYVNYNEMKYNQFGYIYTFTDGTTFNANTQNLTFPDSLKMEDFEVRLITIGADALSKYVDEIQLLTSVIKGQPEDWGTHDYSLALFDTFDSDNYKMDELILNQKQSFEMSKLLNQLILHKESSLKYNLQGNGIGVLVDGKVVGSNSKEEDAYPGENDEEKKAARESEMYKPLRTSYLKFSKNNFDLNLNIESYTDPVKSNFTYKVSGIRELKKQYDSITDNQLLSGFRTFFLAEQFTKELAKAAHKDFKDKDLKTLDTYIENALSKSTVKMGPYTLRYADYAKVAHPDTDFYELVLEDIEKKQEENLKLLGYETSGKKK